MRRARGFTLLELLLAVSLMAVAAAAVFAIMHAGILAERTVKRASGQGRTLALAVDQVARAVQSAEPPRGILAGSFVGENNPAGRGDAMTFHASIAPSGDADSPWGDLAQIRFYLVSNNQGGNSLARQVVRNLLSNRAQTVADEVVCRDVAAFECRYFDGTDWHDDWDSANQDNTLPKAVEMTLTLASATPADGRPLPVDENALFLRRVVLLPCAIGQEQAQ
jgi:general secretion pathway protein J